MLETIRKLELICDTCEAQKAPLKDEGVKKNYSDPPANRRSGINEDNVQKNENASSKREDEKDNISTGKGNRPRKRSGTAETVSKEDSNMKTNGNAGMMNHFEKEIVSFRKLQKKRYQGAILISTNLRPLSHKTIIDTYLEGRRRKC